MTTKDNGLKSAWADWADALVATLFPAGLGAGQHFAFGQTTLVADFANSDPEVINSEIFRIGDSVPQPSPDFVPMGSLYEAYGFFLQRLSSPALASALAAWKDATSVSPSRFNMPTKIGTQAPAGTVPVGPAADPQGSTTYLPAYSLDAGFRGRYKEWQASSVAGRTSDGGVIRVSSAGSAAGAPVLRSMKASAGPAADALPPFIRFHAPGVVAKTSMRDLAGPQAAAPVATTALDSYSLEVCFTGLGTFMLGPTQWFSDTAVRLFASQLTAADQVSYFGRQGVLARRIYQVVIGFEPSATLRFDAGSAGNRNAKPLLAPPPGASIGVGPLSFDSASLKSGTGGDGTTLTIGPAASSMPILLGVVSMDLAHVDPVP
ncbi:hypothetical protein CLD22_13935 [Rubrivivax gelatinosus]|nr:hypothetical protein [Rubrivivax gelatinosus]